jgi:regulatory protein
MGEITSITPQIKDKRRCNIFIDGKFYCGMLLETTVKHRLKVGRSVTEEELSTIQLDSEKQTALDKALTHITASKKTEKQIRDFLKSKGYLAAVSDFVIEKMKEYGFIDDYDYAKQYANFAGAKKGKRLIRMELKAKGVSETEIDKALSETDEETELNAAKTILEKYMKNKTADKETLIKACKHLLGKGFDYETAKSAITLFGEMDEE